MKFLEFLFKVFLIIEITIGAGIQYILLTLALVCDKLRFNKGWEFFVEAARESIFHTIDMIKRVIPEDMVFNMYRSHLWEKYGEEGVDFFEEEIEEKYIKRNMNIQ